MQGGIHMHNIKLKDLVAKHPEVTTFLNAQHIDYCCGGETFLFDAIKEKGYEVETFVRDMKVALADSLAQDTVLNKDTLTMPSNDLINYIQTRHHTLEKDLMVTIEPLLYKIMNVHYEHHGEELKQVHHLFMTLKRDLEEHLLEEEKHVFPRLKTQTPVVADGTLSWMEDLMADHVATGEVLHQLKKITNDFALPEDACPTFIKTYSLLNNLVNDIFLHVYTENSVLFPRYLPK